MESASLQGAVMTGTAASDTTQGRKRRFPRHALDMRVTVQVFRLGNTLSFWGRTTEIGDDGLGATLTGELEPGEVVTLEFLLPSAHAAIRLRAITRYRRGLSHGFEFLALKGEQRGAILRACELLAAQE